MPIDSPWMTLQQANVYSQISQSTLIRDLRSGVLRGSQRVRGGTWRVHRDDLDAYLRGEEAAVQAPAVTRRRSA